MTLNNECQNISIHVHCSQVYINILFPTSAARNININSTNNCLLLISIGRRIFYTIKFELAEWQVLFYVKPNMTARY
jgi:hypothetical protein